MGAPAEIGIRAYRDSDLGTVIELYTAAVRKLTAEHYTAEQIAVWAGTQPDPERWRARLAPVETLLAEIHGDPAGFVSFRWDGYVDLLFTAPTHARRGVATALYREVERLFLARGITDLTVHASLVARPFFAGQGYAVVEKEVVTRDGVDLPRYAMRKALPQNS